MVVVAGAAEAVAALVVVAVEAQVANVEVTVVPAWWHLHGRRAIDHEIRMDRSR